MWSKNLSEKMPKRAILTVEWNFERSLILKFIETKRRIVYTFWKDKKECIWISQNHFS